MESINMSLHVFEQHQVDRALDRTGQMILVITAGVGVYDIDKSQKKADFSTKYKFQGQRRFEVFFYKENQRSKNFRPYVILGKGSGNDAGFSV